MPKSIEELLREYDAQQEETVGAEAKAYDGCCDAECCQLTCCLTCVSL